MVPAHFVHRANTKQMELATHVKMVQLIMQMFKNVFAIKQTTNSGMVANVSNAITLNIGIIRTCFAQIAQSNKSMILNLESVDIAQSKIHSVMN